jgi:TolB-like protein
MKKVLSFFYVSMIMFTSFSQSSKFDIALNAISTDLAEKLSGLNKKNVVVLYITDIDKQMTSAGKYLADVISVNLVNTPARLQVFNRDNLNVMKEIDEVYKDAYISPANAKEIGRILSVDVIVIGKYTKLSNTIKLTLQALDSDNGFVVAACMQNLPLNADAGELLGITVISNDSDPRSSSASNEVTGNVSKNINCKEQNIGDYCFVNQKNSMLVIHYNKGQQSSAFSTSTISIEAGQTSCLYDLSVGPWRYWYEDPIKRSHSGGYDTGPAIISGQFLIEKCQSKKFVLR